MLKYIQARLILIPKYPINRYFLPLIARKIKQYE